MPLEQLARKRLRLSLQPMALGYPGNRYRLSLARMTFGISSETVDLLPSKMRNHRKIDPS